MFLQIIIQQTLFFGKYEVQVNLPAINVNDENAINIDKEIINTFYGKLENIIDNADKIEEGKTTLYTVSYTAYLNENILSLVIKATLKEGDNAQRVMLQSYTYNLSTNKQVKLDEMLKIKGIDTNMAEKKIDEKISDAIKVSENMSSLGLETYKRDKNNEIYKIENSNNYLLGPGGRIFVIYAYGNLGFTTEKDVICIN